MLWYGKVRYEEVSTTDTIFSFETGLQHWKFTYYYYMTEHWSPPADGSKVGNGFPPSTSPINSCGGGPAY